MAGRVMTEQHPRRKRCRIELQHEVAVSALRFQEAVPARAVRALAATLAPEQKAPEKKAEPKSKDTIAL